KTAETKGRELNDRMAEAQALLEGQRKEMEKVNQAREELARQEHRFETARAESEARAKALEQREKRLKEQSAALERERAESKAMMKRLETEGERVSQKEAAVEALVERAIAKEREAIEEQSRKAREIAADLKRKGVVTERDRTRVQALQRDLEARKTTLDARERAIRTAEAQVEKRREELRRMRAQIEELL